ncbi:MAG TPA: thymidine phosphorylase [Myxococcales bacterium]|nr:thymidine phosphorylase [Myxococcales bacterium]
MRAYDVIKKKRDGEALSAEEIGDFLEAFTEGEIPDYQAAALLMAVYFRGLGRDELQAWTQAMLESGDVLDLSEVPGVKVDKHSTGGVGDKVSICLAPLAAACGVRVPMISGRGLGHTGGTLDKLGSIPGFRVDLDVARYRELVTSVGACLIGQTDQLAPADRKLYALRDVTATVESIPLIAASIMSKKLAEGIDGLVLDVKVGAGAFMKDLSSAKELARTMVAIGRSMDKKVVALLTDMEQPLGKTVGNALEVTEAIDVLRGSGPPDLVEVTLALGVEMLGLADLAHGAPARELLARAIDDGRAFEKLQKIVEAQGGDPASLEEGGKGLPKASLQEPLPAAAKGFVTALDAELVGRAAVLLGAGRETLDAAVDPAVGLVLAAKMGDAVEVGQPLCTLHANDPKRLAEAKEMLGRAWTLGGAAPPKRPLVIERVTG